MINNVSSQILSGLGAQAAVLNGKTSIAVPPSTVLYAHFEHVSGVPAPEGVNGVSISKLKILDSMIERLRQMREQHLKVNELPGVSNTEERFNVLIDMMKKQIDAARSDYSAIPYQTPALTNTTFSGGAFFNLRV
jgi:hypothetical protein